MRIVKYILIFTLLFIHLPGIIIAYGLSVVNRDKYFDDILGWLILTRITYLSLFGYVYSLFARLFTFFVNKKIDLLRKSQSKRKTFVSLTPFQKFIVLWTLFLLFQKSSNILIIVTWSTYYQLLAPRTPVENLIQTIFQKFYVSIGDFLVNLTLLYFFYFQGTSRRQVKRRKVQLN